MGLVNEKPVNAKLFKGNKIVFPALIVELFDFGKHRLLGTLQLFDGKAVAAIAF